MATMNEILSRKGGMVHTIQSGATVLEAIRKMNDARIGALVVSDGDRVVGMFTERDVLRRVVEHERPPVQIAVAEVMTRSPLCVSPSTRIEEAARIMRDERIRHLPVVDGMDRLVGMVSIGDVNAHTAREQEAALKSLEEYVYTSI